MVSNNVNLKVQAKALGGKQIKALERNLRSARKEIDKLDNVSNRAKGTKNYSKQTKQVEKLDDKLEGVAKTIKKINGTPFTRFRDATKDVKKAEGAVKKLGNSIKKTKDPKAVKAMKKEYDSLRKSIVTAKNAANKFDRVGTSRQSRTLDGMKRGGKNIDRSNLPAVYQPQRTGLPANLQPTQFKPNMKQKMSKQIDMAKNKMTGFARKVTESDNKLANMGRKWKSKINDIRATTQEVVKYNNAQKNLNNKINEQGRLQRELARAQGKMGYGSKKSQKEIDAIKKKLKGVNKEVKQAGKEFDRAAKKATNFGKKGKKGIDSYGKSINKNTGLLKKHNAQLDKMSGLAGRINGTGGQGSRGFGVTGLAFGFIGAAAGAMADTVIDAVRRMVTEGMGILSELHRATMFSPTAFLPGGGLNVDGLIQDKNKLLELTMQYPIAAEELIESVRELNKAVPDGFDLDTAIKATLDLKVVEPDIDAKEIASKYVNIATAFPDVPEKDIGPGVFAGAAQSRLGLEDYVSALAVAAPAYQQANIDYEDALAFTSIATNISGVGHGAAGRHAYQLNKGITTQDTIESLSQEGIDVFDDQGNYRGFLNVLDEIAAKITDLKENHSDMAALQFTQMLGLEKRAEGLLISYAAMDDQKIAATRHGVRRGVEENQLETFVQQQTKLPGEQIQILQNKIKLLSVNLTSGFFEAFGSINELFDSIDFGKIQDFMFGIGKGLGDVAKFAAEAIKPLNALMEGMGGAEQTGRIFGTALAALASGLKVVALLAPIVGLGFGIHFVSGMISGGGAIGSFMTKLAGLKIAMFRASLIVIGAVLAFTALMSIMKNVGDESEKANLLFGDFDFGSTFANESAEVLQNIGLMSAAGAAFGAMFGPIGIAIGAAIGAGIAVAIEAVIALKNTLVDVRDSKLIDSILGDKTEWSRREAYWTTYASNVDREMNKLTRDTIAKWDKLGDTAIDNFARIFGVDLKWIGTAIGDSIGIGLQAAWNATIDKMIGGLFELSPEVGKFAHDLLGGLKFDLGGIDIQKKLTDDMLAGNLDPQFYESALVNLRQGISGEDVLEKYYELPKILKELSFKGLLEENEYVKAMKMIEDSTKSAMDIRRQYIDQFSVMKKTDGSYIDMIKRNMIFELDKQLGRGEITRDEYDTRKEEIERERRTDPDNPDRMIDVDVSGLNDNQPDLSNLYPWLGGTIDTNVVKHDDMTELLDNTGKYSQAQLDKVDELKAEYSRLREAGLATEADQTKLIEDIEKVLNGSSADIINIDKNTEDIVSANNAGNDYLKDIEGTTGDIDGSVKGLENPISDVASGLESVSDSIDDISDPIETGLSDISDKIVTVDEMKDSWKDALEFEVGRYVIANSKLIGLLKGDLNEGFSNVSKGVNLIPKSVSDNIEIWLSSGLQTVFEKVDNIAVATNSKLLSWLNPSLIGIKTSTDSIPEDTSNNINNFIGPKLQALGTSVSGVGEDVNSKVYTWLSPQVQAAITGAEENTEKIHTGFGDVTTNADKNAQFIDTGLKEVEENAKGLTDKELQQQYKLYDLTNGLLGVARPMAEDIKTSKDNALIFDTNAADRAVTQGAQLDGIGESNTGILGFVGPTLTEAERSNEIADDAKQILDESKDFAEAGIEKMDDTKEAVDNVDESIGVLDSTVRSSNQSLASTLAEKLVSLGSTISNSTKEALQSQIDLLTNKDGKLDEYRNKYPDGTTHDVPVGGVDADSPTSPTQSDTTSDVGYVAGDRYTGDNDEFKKWITGLIGGFGENQQRIIYSLLNDSNNSIVKKLMQNFMASIGEGTKSSTSSARLISEAISKYPHLGETGQGSEGDPVDKFGKTLQWYKDKLADEKEKSEAPNANKEHYQSMIDYYEKKIKEFTPTDAFAKGGVVTSPTVAMIGEQGPEMIIPLSDLPKGTEDKQITVRHFKQKDNEVHEVIYYSDGSKEEALYDTHPTNDDASKHVNTLNNKYKYPPPNRDAEAELIKARYAQAEVYRKQQERVDRQIAQADKVKGAFNAKVEKMYSDVMNGKRFSQLDFSVDGVVGERFAVNPHSRKTPPDGGYRTYKSDDLVNRLNSRVLPESIGGVILHSGFRSRAGTKSFGLHKSPYAQQPDYSQVISDIANMPEDKQAVTAQYVIDYFGGQEAVMMKRIRNTWSSIKGPALYGGYKHDLMRFIDPDISYSEAVGSYRSRREGEIRKKYESYKSDMMKLNERNAQWFDASGEYREMLQFNLSKYNPDKVRYTWDPFLPHNGGYDEWGMADRWRNSFKYKGGLNRHMAVNFFEEQMKYITKSYYMASKMVNKSFGSTPRFVQETSRANTRNAIWNSGISGNTDILQILLDQGAISKMLIPPLPFSSFAKGGIVNKEIMATVGEAGPEAIMPLSKLPGIFAKVFKMVMGRERDMSDQAPTDVFHEIEGRFNRNMVNLMNENNENKSEGFKAILSDLVMKIESAGKPKEKNDMSIINEVISNVTKKVDSVSEKQISALKTSEISKTIDERISGEVMVKSESEKKEDMSPITNISDIFGRVFESVTGGNKEMYYDNKAEDKYYDIEGMFNREIVDFMNSNVENRSEVLSEIIGRLVGDLESLSAPSNIDIDKIVQEALRGSNNNAGGGNTNDIHIEIKPNINIDNAGKGDMDERETEMLAKKIGEQLTDQLNRQIADVF